MNDDARELNEYTVTNFMDEQIIKATSAKVAALIFANRLRAPDGSFITVTDGYAVNQCFEVETLISFDVNLVGG